MTDFAATLEEHLDATVTVSNVRTMIDLLDSAEIKVEDYEKYPDWAENLMDKLDLAQGSVHSGQDKAVYFILKIVPDNTEAKE